MKSSITLAFIFGMSCFSAGAVENSPDAVADSQPDYSDTLTGDWGGRRGSMSAHGYDWEIELFIFHTSLIKFSIF